MGVKVSHGPGWIQTFGPQSLKPILADMSEMPDAAMTLAAVACFASGTSILRGLRTLHVKECDRIAAMYTELTRLGVMVQTPVQGDPDAMTITPPPGGLDCSPSAPPITFETYNDHRMAMALALIGLRRPNISIKDPACVGKTYPTFWKDFAKL
jgi:3-phosphoshikimate 1-carboxyvinyltransferase